MSSSSSITPARPARPRTVLTWTLLATWVVLLVFGVVAMGDPQWLEDLARKGQRSEASAYQHLGDNELKKGNYGLAAAQYVHALSIRADQPAVYLNLGVAYLRQGDLARGEAALLQASRLETTARMRPFIAMHLGDAAVAQKRSAEAVGHYEEALAQGGRRDLVYRKLGAVYLEQKDYALADDAFAKALAAQVDPLLPYEKLLERTREAAEQDSVAHRWLDAGGDRPLTAAEWERYDRQSIDVMLARDQEIAKTHNHLGLIAHVRGNRGGALRHFERSLAIWPDNPDAVRNLRILRASGDGNQD